MKFFRLKVFGKSHSADFLGRGILCLQSALFLLKIKSDGSVLKKSEKKSVCVTLCRLDWSLTGIGMFSPCQRCVGIQLMWNAIRLN